MRKKTEKYLTELKSIFKRARDKHEANAQSAPVMADMSGDAEFFAEVLQKHLQAEGNLNTLHYPVVGIDIDLNADFGLVANCSPAHYGVAGANFTKAEIIAAVEDVVEDNYVFLHPSRSERFHRLLK